MEIDYTVGDEVVCIDPHLVSDDGTEYPCGLELNKIYKVEAMKTGGGFYYKQLHSDMVLTKVVGVINPRRVMSGDGMFCAKRFKKVQKKKTDISVFTGMLKTKKLEKV